MPVNDPLTSLTWTACLKPMPKVFSGIEVKTTGSTFHSLHSQILEVVSDKPRSVGVSGINLDNGFCPHSHWLIPFCTETTTIDEKPCFSMREMLPSHWVH